MAVKRGVLFSGKAFVLCICFSDGAGNMRQAETIASIATSMSDAGIGIIRISGQDAIASAERILERPLSGREANTIRFNRVLDEDGNVLDEVLVSLMRAPFSYTGEDVAEINTHGGYLVMEQVLLLLLKKNSGVLRLAEPGEFTKRAFLNGKMDLTRAEAVQDIISAKNVFAVQNAARQLGGALADRVRKMRGNILHEAAFIEAALDDPDVYEEALTGYGDTLQKTVCGLIRQMEQLLDAFDEGARRKDGIHCAILGEPNTGKSTLLNLLAKQERAIVTDLPGTTRDVIEETVQLDDMMLRITDSAGIRKAADAAEAIGIERAKQNAREADLVLLVTDATRKADQSFTGLLSLAKGKHIVVLLNKTDLLTDEACDLAEEHYRRLIAAEFDDAEEAPPLPVLIRTSFTNEKGLTRLKQHIKNLFFRGDVQMREAYYLTNIRHKEALENARNSLLYVLRAIEENAGEDLYLPDLMDAYVSLGMIIGEAVGDDLLETIFSTFCLGK